MSVIPRSFPSHSLQLLCLSLQNPFIQKVTNTLQSKLSNIIYRIQSKQIENKYNITKKKEVIKLYIQDWITSHTKICSSYHLATIISSSNIPTPLATNNGIFVKMKGLDKDRLESKLKIKTENKIKLLWLVEVYNYKVKLFIELWERRVEVYNFTTCPLSLAVFLHIHFGYSVFPYKIHSYRNSWTHYRVNSQTSSFT